jgi:hypothetical protein
MRSRRNTGSGREAARRAAVDAAEHLDQAEALGQQVVGAVVPVVEVAGDDQRRVPGLTFSMRSASAAIWRRRAAAVSRGARRRSAAASPARHGDLAVQQAAPLEAQLGDVLVVGGRMGKRERMALP